MKKFYFFISIIFFAKTIFAQQLPIYNQFVLNPFLINPAATGVDKYYKATVSVRNQWIGIEGAPTSIFLAGSAPMGDPDKRFYGLGGSIMHDQIGNFQRTSVNANIAAHLLINKKIRLSFGASGGASSMGYNVSKAKANPNDPALQAIPNQFIWQADVGLWAESDIFFVGASINQFANQVYMPNTNEIPLYYTVMAGVKIKSKDLENMAFVPALLYRAGASQQVDLNGTFRYTHLDSRLSFWAGGTYRLNGSFAFMAGGEVSGMVLSYCFESANNSLARIGAWAVSTHEVTLGFRIKKQTRRNFRENHVNIHD